MSLRSISPLLLSVLLGACADPGVDDTGTTEAALNGGVLVPNWQLEEVGYLVTTTSAGTQGCTGTLIADDVALTAAHCVCPGMSVPPSECAQRSSFRFIDVLRKDVPSTPADESLTRGDVAIGADVVVYPNAGNSGWGRNDFALLLLDTPAATLTREVVPRGLAPVGAVPQVGNSVTVAGFGMYGDTAGGSAGDHCNEWSDKRRLTTPLDFIIGGANASVILRFDDSLLHICPGDSGGPMMNSSGQLIGVASNGNMYSNSGYGAIYPIRNWIKSYTDPEPACPVFDASDPDPNFCTADCPCDEGEGHCTNAGECLPGMICVHFAGDDWGLPASYSVCEYANDF